MKKFLVFIVLNLLILSVNAEVLKTGIAIREIPDALFGSWRVTAKLDETNSYSTFKPQAIDTWELSRVGDTVSLKNPLTGANADVSINSVEGNLIVFSKKTPYNGNKVLTDTVNLRLDENKFSGINILKLESYSNIDNHLLKTETAVYKISGEKIYGDNIIKNKLNNKYMPILN